MKLRHLLMVVMSFAVVVFLGSCQSKTADKGNNESTEQVDDHDGHDHDGHDHAGHNHAEGEGHDNDKGTSSMAHGDGVEYTSFYVCPMHCEDSGSDSAGKCPKCEMDYVALDEHMKDGHKH